MACYFIGRAKKSAYVPVEEEELDSTAPEVEEANEGNNYKERWQLVNTLRVTEKPQNKESPKIAQEKKNWRQDTIICLVKCVKYQNTVTRQVLLGKFG